MVLLAEPGFLGFERHVFVAIQSDEHLGIPIEDCIPFARQFVAQRMSKVNLLQLELTRLELRLDVLDEMQIGFLGLRVVGVASHRDVAPRRFLVHGGMEFAPIEQPGLEVSRVFAPRGDCFQPVE